MVVVLGGSNASHSQVVDGLGSLLRPLGAQRGSSLVFTCGLRRRLVSGPTGRGASFPTTLGQLVLFVLAARAEPSPSSQYTRAASSSICLTPYPLVPYLPSKSSSYTRSKRVSSYSGSTRTPRPGGPGRAISILSVYPGCILLDLFDAVSFGPLHIVVQNSLTPSQVFFVYTV